MQKTHANIYKKTQHNLVLWPIKLQFFQVPLFLETQLSHFGPRGGGESTNFRFFLARANSDLSVYMLSNQDGYLGFMAKFKYSIEISTILDIK